MKIRLLSFLTKFDVLVLRLLNQIVQLQAAEDVYNSYYNKNCELRSNRNMPLKEKFPVQNVASTVNLLASCLLKLNKQEVSPEDVFNAEEILLEFEVFLVYIYISTF